MLHNSSAAAPMHEILIIDTDAARADVLTAECAAANIAAARCGSLEAARDLDTGKWRAVAAHAQLADVEIRRWAAHRPVIVYANDPTTAQVVDWMRQGAFDVVDLAAPGASLANAVGCAARACEFARGSANGDALSTMVGHTDAMRGLFGRILKVAPTESTVLIRGESGTGKELVARALHENSHHASAPMVSLNCAAIPDTLIESELFGHERGAFPDAGAARTGLVEAADGGTLFLDEIGELPLEAQARLLRVLQDGEVRRVGTVQTRRVSVRLIAATHRNLRKLLDEGRFREDLYYRLNVVTIDIPPLRERQGDLDTRSDALLARVADKLGKPLPAFSATARRAISDYHWPGNVRELENAIERAAILCDNGLIEAEHLAIEPLAEPVSEPEPARHQTSLEDYFVNFVLDNEDQMTETELAEKLGISRKSLWERRQRLNIPRKRTRRRGTRTGPR